MKKLSCLVIAVAALAFACSKGSDSDSKASLDPAARKAALTAIETAKKAVDAKREELASLKDQRSQGADVGAQIDGATAEVNRMADDLGRQLVDYINADPPVVGEPMRPDQQEAIRMKSAEDILTAKDFITLGGDYRKAIDIYNSALQIDPDNPDLKAALAEAEADRYMTAERFATVKKKMTEDEVVAAIGRPLIRNVREYPEKKVTAWFYPKNEQGEAAGVFFNSKKEVYSTDFNAVKRAQATDAG